MSADDITRESRRPHPLDLTEAETLAKMALHVCKHQPARAIEALRVAIAHVDQHRIEGGREVTAALPVLPRLDRRDVVIAAFEDVQPVHLDPVGIVAVDLHVGTTVTVEIPEEEVADVIGALRARATTYRADRGHEADGIAALHASADRLDAIADQMEPRS